MIIRNKKIIDAQNELDELYKFQDTHMMNYHDGHYIEYPEENGVDLLRRTIFKKRKELCELYIDKMERYVGKKEKDNDTKWYDFSTP